MSLVNGQVDRSRREGANDLKYDWQYAMKEMNHIIARSASLLTEKGRPNPSNARKDEAVAEEKALRQKQEWEQHVESLKKEMEKQEKELKDKDSGSNAEIRSTMDVLDDPNSAMDFQVYGNTPSSCSTLESKQCMIEEGSHDQIHQTNFSNTIYYSLERNFRHLA